MKKYFEIIAVIYITLVVLYSSEEKNNKTEKANSAKEIGGSLPQSQQRCIGQSDKPETPAWVIFQKTHENGLLILLN